MTPKDVLQLTKWIRSLLCEWDSIGVSQWVDDEYDTYAPGIAALLIAGADATALADHLSQIEMDAMGLPGDRTRADEFGH